MKIVTHAEFMNFPAGTIYQNYVPDITRSDLCYKVEQIEGYNDFVLCGLTGMSIVDNVGKDYSTPVSFDSHYRDGGRDTDLYLVYEKEDVEAIIDKLQNLVGLYPAWISYINNKWLK